VEVELAKMASLAQARAAQVAVMETMLLPELTQLLTAVQVAVLVVMLLQMVRLAVLVVQESLSFAILLTLRLPLAQV
jgi:hypothetical protein